MAEKRLSHAYMLVGPDTPERQASVTRLAAELLCPAADGPCMECRDCRPTKSSTSETTAI